MAIRMTGLSSGLDTEAIVGALMSAQSLKKTKIERSKTKLEWKQAKWAELNKKLLKLYDTQVSKMRLQSSYMKKKASVSDPTKASITADVGAVNGSYMLEIKNIATTQYVTGAKLNASKTTDKLVDIDSSLLNKEITVTTKDKTTKIAITEDMTISDFTKSLREAGLEANYDTAQKRFFISSKASGVENAFSITSAGLSNDEVAGRQAIYQAVGYDKMSAANKKIVDGAVTTLQTSGEGTDAYNEAWEALAKASYNTKEAAANAAAQKYVKAKLYSDNYATYEEEAENELKSEYYDDDGNLLAGKDEEGYRAAVAEKAAQKTEAFVNKEVGTNDDVKLQIQTAAFNGQTDADIQGLSEEAKKKYYATGTDGALELNGFEGTSAYSEASIKSAIEPAVKTYANVTDRSNTLSSSALNSLGLTDITVAEDGTVSTGTKPQGMGLVEASDSKILLNNAELTSTTSVVSANGLHIELTGLTRTNEPITFSVSNDVDSVYDSIKSFLTEYNEIMKEMNELYGADSAKGYEPLTKEQKKEMSDDDVKQWEDKIKNSILRRDSTLGDIISSMRSAMTSQTTYNGKKYSLASFGIMTSTDYTEGGLFHIYGDPDDSVYSDRQDKLRKALQDDPEAVTKVLSDIFENLRKTMSNKMATTKTSSSRTFYNDITMKDEAKRYESDIKKWEAKLQDMEDAYYKKFSAMESALAKLQSQQSSLSGLLGNG